MQREQKLEDYIVQELVQSGWTFVEHDQLVRTDASEPLLLTTLVRKIRELNESKGIREEEIQKAVNELKLTLTGHEGTRKLLAFYKYGIPLKFEHDGTVNYVRLFDYENAGNNEYIVSRQVSFAGADVIRVDIILYVNGIPLVNIECKDPGNPAESWENAFRQIKDYEQKVPELYKYVQLGVAAESVAKYFPIVPWQEDVGTYEWKSDGKDSIDATIRMLAPDRLLDLVQNHLFIREEHARATKVVARSMQYRAVEKIVGRVKAHLAGKEKKKRGLIWHWQGSGKTLTMIFAAHKLHVDPALSNPTIFFIVDRDELQEQLAREYAALDMPSAQTIGSVQRLKQVLSADSFRGERGMFIVLIHKFRPEDLAEVEAFLKANKDKELVSTRRNVIGLIDEGHRTEYGVLASQMKRILKSAFFFAFSGTPISKKGKDTYLEFSYPPDELYLDKYFIDDSITDGYTKAIAYQARLDRVHLDRDHLDAFLKSDLEELGEERARRIETEVRKKLDYIRVFLENPGRIHDIVEDITAHFRQHVDGRFKALIVAGSRKACVLYKKALDSILPPDETEVVVSNSAGKNPPEVDEYFRMLEQKYHTKDFDAVRDSIITKFKEEESPKILIVTDMLLTGFDAPVVQTMYLDKMLKEHRLLQAITRTNRPYREKDMGLVIDYVGITKELEKAFAIYEQTDLGAVFVNVAKLRSEFVKGVKEVLNLFRGVDRDYLHEHLVDAVQCVTRNKKTEKLFMEGYRRLRKLYEYLGADEVKAEYAKEYAWLTSVYTFYNKLVHRRSEDGRLIEKYYRRTLELIHRDTRVTEIQALPETVVIDQEYVRRIRQENESVKVRAADIAFALNKLVLVDRHRNPVYESLLERVERLIQLWQERKNTAVLEEGLKIAQEIQNLRARQQQLGLSDLEMAMWLKIKETLRIEEDEDLIQKIRSLFRELRTVMTPTWHVNPELRKVVEGRIRQFLLKEVKVRYALSMEQINNVHESLFEKLTEYESRS